MHLRSSLLLIALLLTTPCIAQAPATLEFDSPKHVVVFTSAQMPSSKPEDSKEFSGTTANVQLPSTGFLFVWDRDSGNMAFERVAEVGKKWRIHDKDFSHIGLVAVQVGYQGEPVAAARVVLKDRLREQSQVLDETANGEADFFIVEPGTVVVTVEYRSGGSPAQPVVQQFSLDLARKAPDPLLKIELPNAVATIHPQESPAATAAGTKGDETKPVVHRSNLLGSVIVFLFTLSVAFGGAWLLYQWAKKNPAWVKGKLDQVGVDVPDVPAHVEDDTAAAVPTLEPAKPQAQSKIILGDGSLPSVSAPVAPIQAVHDQLVLINSSGERIALAEGETIVGREENLGVSLVGESSVSRRHAAIVRHGLNLTVKDLGSTNGTYVNGRRINADASVSPGDDLQFGAVKFRVETK